MTDETHARHRQAYLRHSVQSMVGNNSDAVDEQVQQQVEQLQQHGTAFLEQLEPLPPPQQQQQQNRAA